MFYYWKYEVKRALGVQEGDEISLNGIQGPWEKVLRNSKGDFFQTGKAQIYTRGFQCHTYSWHYPIMVRTKNWSPLILGVITLVALAPLFCALAHTRSQRAPVVTSK